MKWLFAPTEFTKSYVERDISDGSCETLGVADGVAGEAAEALGFGVGEGVRDADLDGEGELVGEIALDIDGAGDGELDFDVSGCGELVGLGAIADGLTPTLCGAV